MTNIPDNEFLMSCGFEVGERLINRYTEWRNRNTGVCLEEDAELKHRWCVYRYTQAGECPDLLRKANSRLLEGGKRFKTAEAALKAAKLKWPDI